ncbi:glycosyltransferase family protein [Nesterenkonia aerolata]|uniref:Glycosyltransferase n=1 Tax=Nesterenkonia aerolata TaxID=3074079 RepID=A0ABU2DQ52_9MICC|nr:glycosyltransferase [Nesterenkonia sp. LY-0111]MDR8018445.1 glycosyltransferase [Nesterenkonia sp. LY-0111]
MSQGSSPVQGRAQAVVQELRTGLWHFRKGGITQVRTWRRRRRIAGSRPDAQAAETPAQAGSTRKQVSFDPAVLPERAPRFPDIRVAVILDDFSMMAWRYEFETLAVTPLHWREELSEHPVDLLLVESAWHGNKDAWQYQLTGSKAPSLALQELVAHCREQNIPTVFWNKEDPPHFEDFLDTARLFDHVFTTDVTLLTQYREALGHDRVGVLPFAAQSAIHNPVRPQHGFHSRDVAFAGMYFAHKFPERREQMDVLLGGAADVSPRMSKGLEIFSRFLGDDERYQFPGDLGDRVVGSLSYPQMLTAYKAYRAFLNVNSVVTSPSMCARRIFEITASGTPVMSAPSQAIGEFFPDDEVPTVSTREEAADVVRAVVRSSELRDRMAHRAQRRIWRGHTYTHRAGTVLQAAGLDHQGDVTTLPTVSALSVTNRPHQIEHLITQVGRQEHVQRQLVLVTHGFELPDAARAYAREQGIEDLITFAAPGDWSLGACLNAAVERADGQVCSKIDDDDLYGPWYLHDLLQARMYSAADVVGKHAHYMYLRSTDATLLRFPWMEHRYTDRVMGPTITAGREVFRAHPFQEISRGEDTGFLESVVSAGGTVNSADRFQFTQWRGSTGHAWAMDDRQILATADLAWYGRNDQHVAA